MRIVIIGNVGSGKSTLARSLAARSGLPLLELDRLLDGDGLSRPDPASVRARLEGFCQANPHWIAEGRAGHLVQAALSRQPRLLFLNPGPVVCLRNCRERGQDMRLNPRQLSDLLQRVADYYRRDADENSLRTHRAIFENFQGPKQELLQPVPPRVADEIWASRPVTGG